MFQRGVLSIIILLMVLSSCRKDDELFDSPNARLNFSTDSITFDTVFTTIGSVTKNFRVYNPYKEPINISSIRLNGGNNSTFRMNVNGDPGPMHSNIEIAAEDSMFIFVEATIDPNNQSNPFVITDFIEFTTNGNRQKVDLVAWGQNAIYFTPTRFSNVLPDFTCLTGPCSDTIPPVNVNWTKDLPYVIYGYVVVDSLDVLTIEAGSRVYFHQNGGLWVYRGGTLNVNGTKAEPVTFQGDRLDAGFRDQPGQWDRIWINEGGNNIINHAIIKNSFIGIQAEVSPFSEPPFSDPSSLQITNTEISNCSGFGILSSIFNLQADNLVVKDCGQYNVAIRSAGNYSFRHCTFSNYFDQAARETPSFFIQNSYITPQAVQVIGVPNIDFYNSIIYGDKENEFATEIINNGSLDLDFQDAIIRTNEFLADSAFKRIIKSPTAQIFENPRMGDVRLSENSVARDVGNLSVANLIPLDILENSRTADGLPDLGAYEFTP